MRVLLDECVPRPFSKLLSNHEVLTVERIGAKGLDNGALLACLQRQGIDVLLTVDQNLPYQQSLQNARVAVIVLRAPTNRLEDLAPLADRVLLTLSKVRPGEFVVVSN